MDSLHFITCGSVDDGKSTLIGRLLLDSEAVAEDQLSSVTRAGTTDLARLTDGLSAEREQGITIDVAYRYFRTPLRKFVIGDAPGHEQYTRNMVTAASHADAAVLLVDATKLDWQSAAVALLPQTRRHALLVHLLRVPRVIFAVNKLDAVTDPERAYAAIVAALQQLADDAQLGQVSCVPVSALLGWNVVHSAPTPRWCRYDGRTLLQILEQCEVARASSEAHLALAVQWVERPQVGVSTPDMGRRVYWGRVVQGVARVGMMLRVATSGVQAKLVRVLDHARQDAEVNAGRTAGFVLDGELDCSRGDWLLAEPESTDVAMDAIALQSELNGTVAWMNDQPLQLNGTYLALHGHRWVKAKVQSVRHRLNIHTLECEAGDTIGPNDIGAIRLQLQQPVPSLPYALSKGLGAMILVDSASHQTAGAFMVDA